MSPRDDIKRLLSNHARRLQKLKEQQALYGLSVDPRILVEIEDIEAEIGQLQTELETLQDIEEQPIRTPAAISDSTRKKLQPSVFISYSHKDETEKEQLLSHLGVLAGADLIDVWSDDRISAGADWEQDINKAMAQAKVAILLISANYLTSEFILRKEVPTFLKRRQSEGLIVLPVIAKACAWKEIHWLARMKVRPKNEQPVWRGGGFHIDEELAAIASEVASIVRKSDRDRETSQVLATLENFLGYEYMDDLPQADEAARWAIGIESSRQPEALTLLRRFGDVGQNAQAYRNLSNAADKRDALTRADLGVHEIEQVVEKMTDLPPPVKILSDRVTEHWSKLIAREQEILARLRPVRRIVSRYIIGPPLRPAHGRLFAGREEIFREIADLWENPLHKHSLVIHGERRMGKTSILLHLRDRLGVEYVPVYANLQALAGVERIGAFLYNLADTIHTAIESAPNLDSAPGCPEQPRQIEYDQTPFVSFRRFMEAVNRAMGERHWLVLALDEFEMVESKLAAGTFPNDLLYQFRDVMIRLPHIVLVFAGCHTLEQMTRRYWSPFFGVARNRKVGYLRREAAETLITNPWDDFDLNYDRQAVTHIMAATGCQPWLLQETCHAIIQHINERLRRAGAQALPTVSAAEVEAVMQTVLETSTYFRGVWNDPGLLKPYERVTLAALAELQAEAKEWIARPEIDARLRPYLDDEKIEEAWHLLGTRDMVDEDGLDRRFTVELVRRWIRKFQPLAEVAASKNPR